MENHPYFGSQPMCMRCFKKRDHAIHGPAVTSAQTVADVPLDQTAIKRELVYTVNKAGGIQQELSPVRAITDPARLIAPPDCPSHTCPRCSGTWRHDYKCSAGTHGLCTKCAQEQSTIINRRENIKQIARENLVHLSGSEAAERRLRGEEFVVNYLIHDPKTGEVNKDWLEKVQTHIMQKMRIIEELRIEVSASHAAIAAQQCEDLNKLTPAEREHYERLALRNKKPRAAKAAKPTPAADPAAAKKKAYEDSLKLFTAQLKAKGLSGEELAAKAERKAKAMMEED